jgi:hypothetical protein
MGAPGLSTRGVCGEPTRKLLILTRPSLAKHRHNTQYKQEVLYWISFRALSEFCIQTPCLTIQSAVISGNKLIN